jgi:hypothetical protein
VVDRNEMKQPVNRLWYLLAAAALVAIVWLTS